MLTESEILEFHLASQRRAARRFLAEPESVTGFDIPLDFATTPGRARLIQVREFDFCEGRDE